MNALNQLFQDHSRNFDQNLYIYPVISRRAQGLSVGINLNPENFCNFACVYCCVLERDQGMKSAPVDLDILERELREMLAAVQDGSFWQHPKFSNTPDDWRILRDITFAGNGEPTSSPNFAQAVDKVFALRSELSSQTKIVLLSNATLMGQVKVQETLQAFTGGGDEIWAKLDAGTDAGLKRINRSKVSLQTLMSNLKHWGQKHPLVIQSLFCRYLEEDMDWEEYNAWLDRIEELHLCGTQLQRVQIYTVARETSQPGWNPLKRAWMEEMAAQFKARFPQITLQAVLPND